jgi:hypothetical protein
VFADKNEANETKQYTRWLTSSLAGARVKGEWWYPMNFDSVLKQCVLGRVVNDDKMLNKDFTKDFKVDNSCKRAECTGVKVTWLGKADAKKEVESMVVRLRNKIDADYLLRTGTAMFGSADALYSLFIVSDKGGPCYNYNSTGTSSRAARLRSDSQLVRKVIAGTSARTKTALSARHAATFTRYLTGRVSCTRSTIDTSDSGSRERGKSSAVLPWKSTCLVVRKRVRQRH